MSSELLCFNVSCDVMCDVTASLLYVGGDDGDDEGRPWLVVSVRPARCGSQVVAAQRHVFWSRN